MKVVEINENTRLPLGFVISLAVMVTGAVMWLSATHSDVAIAKSDIASLKDEKREEQRILRSIDNRLSKIEGKLEYLPSGRQKE